jgi:hypothetical protein
VKNLSGFVAAISIFAILCVGGYSLYWWVTKDSTDRRYDVNTHSQQWNAAKVDQLRNLAHDYSVAVDPGQKEAIGSQFCSLYQVLNPAPPANATDDLFSAHSTICLGG